MTRLMSLVTIVALLLSVGCSNTLRLEDDVTVANPDGLDRLIFGDYWDVDRIPGGIGDNKVCIAEFNVEFVRERVLNLPDKRGLTSRRINYERGLVTELPGHLKQLLVERMETTGGRTVLSQDQVVKSAAYKRYATRANGDSGVKRFDKPIAASGGRIRVAETHPAAGLQVLEGTATELTAVDQALATELGAAVMRVQIRVGVQQGRATVESGSYLTVTVPNGETGQLRSQRSLATHDSVLVNYGFVPSTRGEFRVSKDDLMKRIDKLFLSYISLVTEVLDD